MGEGRKRGARGAELKLNIPAIAGADATRGER
jgi:hypothetical protein